MKARNRVNQSGFTYPVVMALVVIVGISASVAVEFVSTVKQREDEAELLFRGLAYRDAIKSYYESGKTVKTFPRELSDLLLDPRYIHRRHIRILYEDPVSDQDWLLIRAPDGGIQGVASQSNNKPRKSGNFPFGLESLENTDHYSDWIFIYDPIINKKPILNANSLLTTAK
ncbi:MAG: type II secretion system GspH family protein [Candidatus Thiodiazotropha sp. (ex Lucinoma borealis)]|nr:type II secretion system GspH family protein [Candidatus Thiodiazotropha sp. (ex Lucinoma borealis)]MCU7866779.1 type II secretion system GspH family protein [Candidatus Thiodiazotropha sp. (ex Lucinoma borealis)]